MSKDNTDYINEKEKALVELRELLSDYQVMMSTCYDRNLVDMARGVVSEMLKLVNLIILEAAQSDIRDKIREELSDSFKVMENIIYLNEKGLENVRRLIDRDESRLKR